MIIETAQDLTKRIQSYNPMLNEDKLKSAFFLAERAHHGQVRSSGDPYFTHPLEVAQILADMHLDEATIITALLHDVVEDTNVSLYKIRREFGAEIARLVDGVTKLTRLEMQSNNKQAENFRKLLLAMSEDIRVLLVKLADRTHNMRTIDFIADHTKRRRIAQETLSIFAPLLSAWVFHISSMNWKTGLSPLSMPRCGISLSPGRGCGLKIRRDCQQYLRRADRYAG